MHDSEVTALLAMMLGRRLLMATEARLWSEGRGAGDSEGLMHFWLHFERCPTLMGHGHGEQLILELSEPYASYDMQEYGQTIVAAAQEPDALASVIGQRLLNVALIHAFVARPQFAGMLLEFERKRLLVATFADELLFTNGEVPTALQEYLSIGDRLIAR